MPKRVLIVEDSPAMRRLIGMALKREPDVEIAEASDGVEALKLLSEKAFDIAFVDINMPVLDGMRFLTRLQQDNLASGLRIAMVTTEAGQEQEAEARAAGAHYYLRKPINRRDIERVFAD